MNNLRKMYEKAFRQRLNFYFRGDQVTLSG